MKPHSIVVISVILITVYSCGRKTESNELLNNVYKSLDTAKFIDAISKTFVNLKDSDHAYFTVALNNADTVQKYFADKVLLLNWLDKGNSDFTANLFKWFKTLDNHGLDSNYYNAKLIKNFTKYIQIQTTKNVKIAEDTIALYEILMADALYTSINDMRLGRVSPAYSGTPNLFKSTLSKVSFIGIIDNVFKVCNSSIPNFKEYNTLQSVYAEAKKLPLSYYNSNHTVNAITKDSTSLSEINCRLIQLGVVPYKDSSIAFPTYQHTTTAINKLNLVLDSQKVFWNETLKKELNFNKTQLLQKMALNLERWRWTGPIATGNRIWVNTARNELDAYRNDTLVLTMRVCTGKARIKSYAEKWLSWIHKDSGAVKPQNNETPLMKSHISHMVVFPNWKIPQSILVNELLSKIRRNPGYIHRLGYKLKTYSGKEVNPYSVNWSKSKYPYYLEQPGGNGNALGKIIFYFENQFSVYCHDTPSKGAFGQDNRHVSHGCIRLQKPFDFAGYIQSIQKENNMDYVRMAAGMDPVDTALLRLRNEEFNDTLVKVKTMGKKINKRFGIETKIPIYIVYFTCEVQNGTIRRFSDGYRRDEMLAEAMKLGASKTGIY